LLAATSGNADRYVLLARLEFLDLIPERGIGIPAGTGYVVQAADPSNLGALSAFLHSDARPVERANPALMDVAVTPDGTAAFAVGSETVRSRGRRHTTPLLFRVDLTPREGVPLPDFQIAWAGQPTLSSRGPDANGDVVVNYDRNAFPLRVTNSGATDLASVSVSIWLSTDDRLDASDRVLGYGDAGSVAAGATVTPTFSSMSYVFREPGFTGLIGKRLIAVINPDGWRPESDTTDNVAVSDPLP
jgi:hypothetical protein